MAQAYPNVRVDGFDLDEPSIEEAWTNAHSHGLTDRLTFHARNAADLEVLNGRYDLVTAFECVHDLGNLVGVLRVRGGEGMRGALTVFAFIACSSALLVFLSAREMRLVRMAS